MPKFSQLPGPALTPTHIALLSALAGQHVPVSGQTLADGLGLTRARVSQLAGELSASGATISASRAGYAAPWCAEMLNAAICAEGTELHISVVPIIESTNTALMAQGAPHRTALLAEAQTAGRGRRGRSWASVPGGSVLLSLAWQFTGGAAALSGLSLSVGVAIVRALADVGVTGVQLKWPNDVLWRGQKLGGVLIELSGDALGPTGAVVGVGLNVVLPVEAREDITQPVCDLRQVAPKVLLSRNQLANALLKQLAETLTAFADAGFAADADAWRAAHAFEGKAVSVRLPDGRIVEGDAATVNDSGALVIKRGASTTTLHSADVSLRRIASDFT